MSEPNGPGVLLVIAHPALERSRANRALVLAAAGVTGVAAHDLYETYPDFVIDVEAEQARLIAHPVIALQFPLYWYATPALLKEWLDLVWLHGFAYGRGGEALKGKRMLAACSTGAPAEAYGAEGGNRFTIEEFLRPLQQTAALCGMAWEPPFVLHASATKPAEALRREAGDYAQRLTALAAWATEGRAP